MHLLLRHHGLVYPTPVALSYWWNLGFIAGMALLSQMVTGIFLAMHYLPSAHLAFASVEHIMRDVSGGWLIRYWHANGASLMFAVVYLHMAKGVYHSSFTAPRQYVWLVGVMIVMIMIITAFIGYVLPWGQMTLGFGQIVTSVRLCAPMGIFLWLRAVLAFATSLGYCSEACTAFMLIELFSQYFTGCSGTLLLSARLVR